MTDQNPIHTLLQTKITIPPPRAALIARPRLLDRLDVGAHRLTLLSAPPGYGKTTLLGDWARAAALRVAWLSLDESDDQPIRFWSYLVAALQQPDPALGSHTLELLRVAPPPPIEAMLTPLLNDLAALPAPLALVLDDYHVISDSAIHAAIGFLLEHLPPHAHLVIGSRIDPPLALPRLRARGRLLELRAADLRCTTDEATAFLTQTMKLPLDQNVIRALQGRTEGWIAALQLAGLSLRDQPDISNAIERWNGDNRYLVDYLADEVLDRQPTAIRDFLLQTSLLDQLNASLCSAVLDGIDLTACRQMLDQLERSNLFVVALDDARRAFRYHHLWGAALRQRLEQTAPDRIPHIHDRAARWYAANDAPQLAMRHALAAQNNELAAGLLNRWGGPMLSAGEWTALLGWIGSLPEAFVRSRPELCLLHGWALALTGQTDRAEDRVSTVEQLMSDANLASTSESLSWLGAWRGQVAAIRATAAMAQNNIAAVARYSRQALALLPNDDLTMRSALMLSLGVIELQTGDLDAAERLLDESLTASRRIGNASTAASALGALAQLDEERGAIGRAEARYRELLWSALPPQTRSNVQTRLAALLIERNQLAEAQEHVANAIADAERVGSDDLLALARMQRALALHAGGDRAADDEAALALNAAQRSGQALVAAYLAAQRARLAALRGAIDEAERWNEQHALPSSAEPPHLRELREFTAVRIAIARSHTHRAIERLNQLQPAIEAARRNGRLIEVLALRAVALAGSDHHNAIDALVDALRRAAPERFIRVFLDLDTPMSALLANVIASPAIEPAIRGYARRLLDHIPDRNRAPADSGAALIEPLSERELGVLRLIALGRSNQQIADELILAVGTVKKHLNNIFGKLDVQSRTEAVARARDLDLL